MARPNIRHTEKSEKSSLFGNGFKSLFGTKAHEESHEDEMDLVRQKYEDMEEGFIKTKPREYPPQYDNTISTYEAQSSINLSMASNDVTIENKKSLRR